MDKYKHQKKYYIKNKDKIKKYNKEYYSKNIEEIRKKHNEWQKKWIQNASPEIKNRINERARNYNKRVKKEVFLAYGNKCVCCGETKIEFLAMDHIENNGSEHRFKIFGRKNTAGARTYGWLRRNNYPSGFQILCHNCNLSKGFYGYCPHTL